MSDALIVWDARHENKVLALFIEEFCHELERFSLTFKVVSINDVIESATNQIKPSMKALLDIVHKESPLHLITFGSKANSLASLISPALRCKLHTNKLPDWLDKSEVSSAIKRIARYMHKEDNWGDGTTEEDYLFPRYFSSASAKLLSFSEDPLAESIVQHARLNQIDLEVGSLQEFLPPSQYLVHECGLLIVSEELQADFNLVDVANAYGMPVMLISKQGRRYGIIEGENGWVVNSIQQIPYINFLKNWQEMSQNAREMISLYSRSIQSDRSGLRCYCSSFGYPERLELKDFKLRG